MKNEVKKKMMMQELEPAVPKSLNEKFCTKNVQEQRRVRHFFSESYS
jgi:hypothetical protein